MYAGKACCIKEFVIKARHFIVNYYVTKILSMPLKHQVLFLRPSYLQTGLRSNCNTLVTFCGLIIRAPESQEPM